MIELKPCPFCGREAVLSSIHIGDGDYRAMVTCTRIGLSDDCASVMVERSSRRTAEQDAVKKWNTRAERTCHNVWDVELTGRLRFQCSECKAVSLEITPRYCPVCGAKVVEE